MTEQPLDSGAELRDRLTEPRPSWGDLRKQSDHADKAYEFLNSAPFNGDPEVTKAMIRGAEVHAKLALHDKIEELAATIRFCTNQILDSNEKLNENVKTAARHLHADANDLKAHLRVVQDGEAA